MSSIRRRLLLSLFIVWATTWIAVAAVSLDRANHEVGELMDAQLAQTAHVLRQITQAGNLPDVVSTSQGLSPIGHAYEAMLSFQLWRDGKLISRFGAAPDEPLGNAPGFSTQVIADTQWRVFGLSTNDASETLYVGQSYAIRQELIEYLTLHALRPILWSMPLAVLLIWLAVTDGLRPLRRLRSQITHRSADQLDPIEMRSIPTEIRPLTAALNGLMKRLDRALAAERHFAADASHELRTPFAAIRTHAQIAQRSKDAQERHEALAQLIRGIDRASHLISQLLILSRLHHRVNVGETTSCSLVAIAAQAEPFEGVAMAGEPGGDILAPDELGVLMPAQAERHDEDPGLAQLIGVGVEDARTGAEVDLSGFAGGEVQAHRGLERCGLVGLQEAADGRVAAAEAVLAHQGLVDGGASDASPRPGEDALTMGLNLGAWPGIGLTLAQDLGEGRGRSVCSQPCSLAKRLSLAALLRPISRAAAIWRSESPWRIRTRTWRYSYISKLRLLIATSAQKRSTVARVERSSRPQLTTS
jgi:hypothetical protein